MNARNVPAIANEAVSEALADAFRTELKDAAAEQPDVMLDVVAQSYLAALRVQVKFAALNMAWAREAQQPCH